MRIGVELVILFCDTSALMKLLVDEAQSNQMRQISTTVDGIGVCRISWAETMAALAQAWKTFTIVEVSQPLVETAERFADVFALQGYDSVQLAAAHELQVNTEQKVLFACYDRRLNQAAQVLQLEVLP